MSTVLRYEMFFALLVLLAIIGYRLLTGSINTSGLLRQKIGGRVVSPGRLQMLIVTVAMTIYFAAKVIQTKKLPNISQEYLMVFAGSHLFYLEGKIFGLLAEKLERAVARIAKSANGG